MVEENNEEYHQEEGYEKSDEEDVYKEEDVEGELEQDEITPAEAGFMEGYDRRLEKEAEEIARVENESYKPRKKQLKKSHRKI